ncbi:MAG: hotdog family protein [Planctomycetota bacterium]|jgi:3-hydroxymyristoyl/3-hydroxydecanoyl-(acyl carrier protein) dehydratase
MKGGERYEREAIAECIPHRGRNFVIDSIDFFEEDGLLKGRSKVTIAPGDAEGRDIFLLEGEEGPVYSEFVLVEHVALTSSVLIAPKKDEGNIAFFSTITNFRGGSTIAGGETVEAVVTPLGRRGPFHRSRCLITAPSAAGEIKVELMAAVVDGGERVEGEKKAVEPPRIVEMRPVDRAVFSHKDAALVFVDEECSAEVENRTMVARYTYPVAHPFVPGHFPGNPVMMGVTQWAGMLDCGVWLANRLDLGGGPHIADGEILRADGTLVTEIRGMEFEIGPSLAQILKTKRIGFRDMVTTGEEIFYRIRLR